MTIDESRNLPILSNLEKKIILILGEDYYTFKELTRYSAKDIKIELNEFNEKYDKPIRSSSPQSTIKSLERKELIESVSDTHNGRRMMYYSLTDLGIEWFFAAKKIEESIWSK